MKKSRSVPEEISAEVFNELNEVDETGRVKLVDYDELVDKLDGRYLTIAKVVDLMIECSHGQKAKVYYSEALGAIQRLQKQGLITFERGQGQRIYYHFQKVEQTK